ncbi:MAG TPA: transposase [Longimicrobiales bacterium]|nr:transposase [Longimicrobiales bacterium]
MSRRHRPNLPGVPFHFTARLQNGEPLFAGLERRITRLVRGSATQDGARPFAYAVMSNHLHLLVVQGAEPPGRYMHRLLHAVALMVQDRWGREGHVFQRRYHAVPCLDAEQMRTALAYVHLNPVRAGLCGHPGEYRWTSHADFCGSPARGDADRFGIAVEQALGVFASAYRRGVDECRADYRAYVAWRVELDAFVSAGGAARSAQAPAPPLTRAGDLNWSASYADRLGRGTEAMATVRRPRADLRRIALAAIRELAPGLRLTDLRSGSKCIPILRVRRRIIAHALAAGYAGCQIGRYLRVSSSTVSRVAVALRDGAH